MIECKNLWGRFIGRLARVRQVIKKVLGWDRPLQASRAMSEAMTEANSPLVHGVDYCCGSCTEETK